MAIVPHSTRYDAERAVIADFMTRAEGKLGHVREAAGLLRAARTKLERDRIAKAFDKGPMRMGFRAYRVHRRRRPEKTSSAS